METMTQVRHGQSSDLFAIQHRDVSAAALIADVKPNFLKGHLQYAFNCALLPFTEANRPFHGQDFLAFHGTAGDDRDVVQN